VRGGAGLEVAQGPSSVERERNAACRHSAGVDAGAGRAGQAIEERDWLLAELSAGTGLGGTARTFSDSGERARTAVGKAIRRATDRIHEADEIVGDHLRRSVNTGTRCAYLA
jgi:hypothetical protein